MLSTQLRVQRGSRIAMTTIYYYNYYSYHKQLIYSVQWCYSVGCKFTSAISPILSLVLLQSGEASLSEASSSNAVKRTLKSLLSWWPTKKTDLFKLKCNVKCVQVASCCYGEEGSFAGCTKSREQNAALWFYNFIMSVHVYADSPHPTLGIISGGFLLCFGWFYQLNISHWQLNPQNIYNLHRVLQSLRSCW